MILEIGVKFRGLGVSSRRIVDNLIMSYSATKGLSNTGCCPLPPSTNISINPYHHTLYDHYRTLTVDIIKKFRHWRHLL